MPQTPKPEIPSAEEQSGTPLTKRQISHAAYYATNKERIIAYRKKYHEEHREEILKKVRDHYHANKDKRLAYGKKWRDSNQDKMRTYRHKFKDKLRRETFEAYGGPKCNCCGVDMFQFLSIDHINNNGKEHREELRSRGGTSFYIWLRKNGYPSGYQVLCFNCNISKAWYGMCPHQMPMTTYAPL